MKWLIAVTIAGLAVVVYLTVTSLDDAPQGAVPDASVTQSAAPQPEESPILRLSKAVGPSLSDQPAKVVLDDGPRYPGEEYGRYTRRVKLVQMLKSFIKKAELTKDQEHQILIALYDLQQNRDALREDAIYRSGAVTEDEWGPLMDEYMDAFHHKRDYILEPWQQDVWYEECRLCFLYAAQGILRLETDDPTKQKGRWWKRPEQYGG